MVGDGAIRRDGDGATVRVTMGVAGRRSVVQAKDG